MSTTLDERRATRPHSNQELGMCVPSSRGALGTFHRNFNWRLFVEDLMFPTTNICSACVLIVLLWVGAENKDSDNWEIIVDEEERPQNFKLKQTVFELYLFLLSWLAPEMSKVENVPDYCQLLEIKGSDGTVKQLLFPKALDLNRPKRPRTIFSIEQLKRLDTAFEQNPYLVGKEREKLAKDLGLSETQVKVWYQNKRTKLKKTPQSSDSEHDKNSDKSGNNNNNESPKVSQVNQFPSMPDFSVFPMQQWLFNPQTNFQPNESKTANFCSNFFY